MAADEVKVRWAGKRQFTAWDDAGHGIVVDATPEYGGEGSGVRPVLLVLYALGTCTAMDVISILEKKREPVVGLEIEISAMRRQDDYPKIYTRIELLYVVTGKGVKPGSVARAIQLSEEKYCSVRGMLGPQVEVVTGFRIEEQGSSAS
jgi:putative redox protein